MFNIKLKSLFLMSFTCLCIILGSGFFIFETQKSNPLPSTQGTAYVSSKIASSEPAFAASPAYFNPNIFVDLAKKVVPSVVNISIYTRTRVSGSNGDPFYDMFEKFFGPQFGGPGGLQPPPRRQNPGGKPRREEVEITPSSLGSGFVIDEQGLILTNNHVVQGADAIKVYFTEDSSEIPLEGEVVGRDPELDIALVKVKTNKKLIPLTLGDSTALQVGEFVMAVGNPVGHGHSVTHGIISAKDRDIPDFVFGRYIQTDTAINPGNSGGPLVNLNGEVIGVNNAIDARAQSIGFAIPSNLVKRILPQLKSKGRVSRGYIGVLVDELTPEFIKQLSLPKETKGVLVTHVSVGDPAEKAGLKTYDIITEFNGESIRTSPDLIRAVTALEVGSSAPMKILRDGKVSSLTIKATERPSDQQAALQGQQGKRSQPSPIPKKGDFESVTGMSVIDLNEKIAQELGLPAKMRGAVVAEILKMNSPAQGSGLTRGDVIVEVNRKPVNGTNELKSLLKSGKSYLLKVARSNPSRQNPRGPFSEVQYILVVFDLTE